MVDDGERAGSAEDGGGPAHPGDGGKRTECGRGSQRHCGGIKQGEWGSE